MKRFVSIVLVCLILILPLTVFAADADRVCDMADLLSVQEEHALREYARNIYETSGLYAVIVTINSLEGKSARNFADDFYDYSGYGSDGILLLVAMEDREWHISTSGRAVDVFSDYDLYDIEERILPDLSSGDYYSCFEEYLEAVTECYDYYVYSSQPRSIGSILITSLLIGAVIAGITLLIMRSSMNTKRRQYSAGDYLTAGSFHMTAHRDIFLYSQVSKTRRQQQSSSGSTTHRNSSGASHGGRGGKF